LEDGYDEEKSHCGHNETSCLAGAASPASIKARAIIKTIASRRGPVEDNIRLLVIKQLTRMAYGNG
jgi:hypothetical protein